MSTEVRDLRDLDWPNLWPSSRPLGTPDDEAESKRTFTTLTADPRWLIVGAFTESGKLVAYAAAQDYGPHLRYVDHRTARLHDLRVKPEARRTGVGRALMHIVHRWAAVHVRYLEWQAHETTAAPFYERLQYHGEPCPPPEYPYFEVTFDRPAHA